MENLTPDQSGLKTVAAAVSGAALVPGQHAQLAGCISHRCLSTPGSEINQPISFCAEQLLRLGKKNDFVDIGGGIAVLI